MCKRRSSALETMFQKQTGIFTKFQQKTWRTKETSWIYLISKTSLGLCKDTNMQLYIFNNLSCGPTE